MKKIKMISLLFTIIALLSVTAPTVSVVAAELDDNETDTIFTEMELDELNNSEKNFDMELFLNDVYSDPELVSILEESKYDQMSQQANSGQIQTMGVKTVAAKVAVKGMIKTVKKIGKAKWNKLVAKAPAAIAKYVKYDTVLQVFNIVTGVEGTIENGLIKGFKSIGMNNYWAGVAARLVMTLAL